MLIRGKNIDIKRYCDDKVIVEKAQSFDDQIRFYLNDNIYVTATERQNGGKYKISLGDESIEKNDDSDSKNNEKRYNRYAKLILFQVLSSLSIFIITLIAIISIEKWIFYIIIPSFTILLTKLINSAILNLGFTSKKLRGKHSAEHMMVKFIEANNRMPITLDEIRKYSGLYLECGSRLAVESTAEYFGVSIINIAITIIFSSIMKCLFSSPELIVISSIAFYMILWLLIPKLFIRYKTIFEITVGPIKNIIILINQLTMTTRKVKDDDLILAYLAARQWMIIAYPEFYNRERDDTIWRENIVNIEIEEPDW